MIGALWNHLWQSTLFLGLACCIAALLRRHTSRTRYLVWFAASMKFLLPWSALLALGEWLRPAHSMDTGFVSQPLLNAAISLAQAGRPSAAEVSSSTEGTLLLVIWGAGAALFAIRWYLSWLHTRHSVDSSEIYVMDVPVEVRVSEKFAEPGVFGILEPVLLLPRNVLERMSCEELDAVVAHELCHVRHRDNLTAAFHMLAQAVFWFHPLLWWLGRCLLEERERACDEVVIQLGARPQAYAEGIVKACAASLESRLGVIAGASGANLAYRIRSIVAGGNAKSLGLFGKTCLVTCTAAAVLLPVAAGAAIANDLSRSRAAAATPLQLSKPFIQTSRPGSVTSNLVLSGGRLSMHNTSLRRLISVAYGTSERQIFGGPSWLDHRYDIEVALADRESDPAHDTTLRRRMIIDLLAREFQLQFIERNLGSAD